MAADAELLRGIPFFEGLEQDDERAIAELMSEARFAAGAPIFRQADPGGTLFVIAEGRVELSVRDEQGERIPLDTLEPGEFFGEVSLLDGGTRTATAEALEPVRAFCLTRDTLTRLLKLRPEVGLAMVTALGRRLRRTNEILQRRVRNPNEVLEEQATLADRISDGVARFGGSWRFILSFGALLTVWILLNTLLFAGRAGEPFDPYPFILLNLVLSMVAAMQAPVIMMSQNRQDTRDRLRSELDYQVNVKAELEILELLERVDALTRLVEARRAGAGAERDGAARSAGGAV